MTDNAWDRAAIGSYVTRVDSTTDAPLTRPHLTDSLVADEPVTRCGRRLRQREGTTLRFEAVPARRICVRCER